MIKKIVVCLCCILFLTGCGSKTLKCTQRISDFPSVKADETISFEYKNKKVVSIQNSIRYIYTENIDSNYEVMANSLKEQFSIYDASEAIDYNIQKEKNGLLFVVKINVDKLTEEESAFFGYMLKYKDSLYKDVVNDLNAQGYQCKELR